MSNQTKELIVREATLEKTYLKSVVNVKTKSTGGYKLHTHEQIDPYSPFFL